MDKIPIIPPDPMEAVQVPVRGADQDVEESSPQADPERRPAYTENEGVSAQNARDIADSVSQAPDDKLEAAAEAAQRGQTA
jgi:hypothetical protein